MAGAARNTGQRQLANDAVVRDAESIGHLADRQPLAEVQVAKPLVVDPRIRTPDAGLSEPPADCPGCGREHRSQLLLRLASLGETTQIGVVNRAGPAGLAATHTGGGKKLGDALAADGKTASYLLLRHTAPIELGDLVRIGVASLPPAREQARRRLRTGAFSHNRSSRRMVRERQRTHGAGGRRQLGLSSVAGGSTVTDPGAG